MPAVNPIAVAAATVVAMIIGTIYYMPSSPMGKRWMALVKAPAEERSPGSAMALQVVISVLSIVALAVIIRGMGAAGAAAGAVAGFWVWLVVALATAGDSNFSGRAWALWAVNQINWPITFLAAGAIIASL
ncbi:MAG: DUF1761 domain-containing protein [Chloroflexi bacterium]|nr:DUF1761 domain-containing protein [Chloroflexota bacterium]